MKNNSYRITILLYLGILILPLAFYYSFHQLKLLEEGSLVVRELGRNGGEVLLVPQINNPAERKKELEKVEQGLKGIESWFVRNDSSEYYVGKSTPLQDYRRLVNCVEELKNNPDLEKAKGCWRQSRELSFAVERMVALRTDHLRNALWLTLAGSMLLLLLLVFFVRAYIHQQLKKEALRDEETGLFNRKYIRAALANLLAQGGRSGQPLSTLYCRIGRFNSLPSEKQEALLRELGEFLSRSVRESDIAARYETDSFLVVLSNTDEEGAKVFEDRLMEEMAKILERYGVSPEVKVATAKSGEKEEEFLAKL